MPFEFQDEKHTENTNSQIEIPQWAKEYAAKFYSNTGANTSFEDNQNNEVDTGYSNYPLDVDWWGTAGPAYPSVETFPVYDNPTYDGSYEQDKITPTDQAPPPNKNPYWQRIASTIDSMLGSSIKKYDPTVPENLGCARFVSAALHRAYGLPIYDANMYVLEKSLLKHGFLKIPLEQAQPGDVIIGFRAPGDHGHAAIYMGDNQIANNNSNKRRIVIDPIDKFYAPDFKKVYAYHLPV